MLGHIPVASSEDVPITLNFTKFSETRVAEVTKVTPRATWKVYIHHSKTLVEKRSITFGCKTKELDVAGSHEYMFDVKKLCKIFAHKDISASKSGIASWI